MLRRLGIRAKVMAVLAVPMLVLLGTGAYISINALAEARQVRAAEGVIAALEVYAPLASAIQTERTLTLAGGTREQVEAARKASDQALHNVFPKTGAIDRDEFPSDVVKQFDDVQYAHNEMLPSARKLEDIKGPRAEIGRYYSTIITGQIALMESVANSLPNRDLARYVTTYGDVAATSDGLVSELIDAAALVRKRTATDAAALTYANEVATNEATRERARASVEALGLEGVELNPDDPSFAFTNLRSDLQQGTTRGYDAVDMNAFGQEIQNQLLSLSAVNDSVLHEAHSVATTAAENAQRQALLTIGGAILAAALSLMFAVFIARGITRPLRRLTVAAGNVREQLPKLVEQVAVPGEGPGVTLEPIPVTTRDEIGELAQAFNEVNATTVQVAQEQAALRGSIAEMFVNVARRDQVLLNRQLSFIDSLERAEEDPSTLANLFRLDHLATRMRRNAESLLVLAGIDSGRRLRDAMPLSDVVRTASSEIEQYDRVQLDLQVDPAMHGFNALSAAHMLAELLENATVFSEPETPVVVTTGVVGQFVVVRILDQGLGMSDAELETANARIRSTGAGDALGAQRLGLFVVGRLAHRLGADVYLGKSSHGTGTETIVRFPASLFAATETSLYGAPTPSEQQVAAAPVGPDGFEPPVVEEVNLAALTDGATALGLPRRRRGDDPNDTDTNAEGVPGLAPAVAGAELPSRPRKTFDEDKIVLPEAPSGNISVDLNQDSSEWRPPTIAAEPLKNLGLPSRTRAATSAWAQQTDQAQAASVAPSSPSARAGLFSGFRGRGDLHTATPASGVSVPGLAPEDDRPAAAPDAVRAPWMSLGAHATPVAPVVVPALVDEDDEPWTPAVATQDEVVAETQDEVAAADEHEESAWAPEQAWAPVEAEAEQTWAPAEAAAEVDPAWAPLEAAAEVEQTWAPVEAAAAEDAAADWAPAATVEPTWESAAEWEPVAEAGVEEQSAEEVPAEQVRADELPAEPALAEQAWGAAEAETAETEEVWAPVEPSFFAQAEPVRQAQAEHAEPSWAPAEAADVVEDAEPVWAPVVASEVAPAVEEPAFAELVHAEPVHAEPVHAEPLHTEHLVEQAPAAEAEQQVEQPEVEAVPVAAAQAPVLPTRRSTAAASEASEDTARAAQRVARVAGFTSYSGYAGWAGSSQKSLTPHAAAEQAPFERTLDEARAWHTGAHPVVPAARVEPSPAVVEESAPAVVPASDAVETAAEHVADSWPTPAWEAPTWEAPTWQAPSWQEQDAQAEADEPAADTAPGATVVPSLAPDEAATPWLAAAPTWPAQEETAEVAADATQLFTPVEAADAVAPFEQVQEAAPFAPAPAPHDVAVQHEVAAAVVDPTGGWGAAPTTDSAFPELGAAGDDESRPKRRWGLFGKRKGDEGTEHVEAAPTFTPPADVTPVRTSAWSAEEPAASTGWSAPSWSTPAAAAEPAAAVTPATPAPAPLVQRTPGSWSPPEWASSARPQAPGAPVATVPQPNVPPSVAPRIGTLDDEVAAMLALRSDIQEQALSELSQLSAYRPAMGGSAEQLTRRVPTAVPTTSASADEGKPVQRDADQLRSRLSSFQSGTSRGRRAAEDPSTEPNGPAS